MGAQSAAEFCRIERWRGYVASSFYVRLPDGTVLKSQEFRWRRAAPPPDKGSARVAYEELIGRLAAAGWTRQEDGTDWFATTFTRITQQSEEIPLQPAPPNRAPTNRVIEPPRVVALPETPPRPPDAEPTVAPEPAPTADGRAKTPEPPQIKPQPDRARRRFTIARASGAALVVTLVAVIAVVSGHGDSPKVSAANEATPQPNRAVLEKTTRSATTPQLAKRVAAAARNRAIVDVRIAAHGSGSWVEVRRGSATGTVLHRATLQDGQSLHLHAPRLWARFGAASNLTITSNGRPVQLQGTYEKLFVP